MLSAYINITLRGVEMGIFMKWDKCDRIRSGVSDRILGKRHFPEEYGNAG